MRFIVEGRGPFPVDMLRYDRCFPHDSADASQILEPRERRKVTLTTDSPRVTPARWRSFGWVMTEAYDDRDRLFYVAGDIIMAASGTVSPATQR